MQRYCDLLSQLEDLEPCYDGGERRLVTDGMQPHDCLGYRLPTYAEWNYAKQFFTKANVSEFVHHTIGSIGGVSSDNIRQVGGQNQSRDRGIGFRIVRSIPHDVSQ